LPLHLRFQAKLILQNISHFLRHKINISILIPWPSNRSISVTPRFLITLINVNDRISQVKQAEHRSNLGQPGSSPRKPLQWTLLDPLTKSTCIRGQPLVKDPVKTGLTVDVSECRPELLLRSPNFT
jgi:hypothetical protein